MKSGTFRVNSKYERNSPIIPTPNSFFFRLANNMIYYSQIEDDIRILDSFSTDYIYEVKDVQINNKKQSSLGDVCFKVSEKEGGKFWNLCAKTTADKNKWICAIKRAINQDCNIPQNELDNHIFKKQIINQPMIIIPIPSPMCNEKWNYETHGNDWECKCKEGRSQSPIDLPAKESAVKISNQAMFSFHNVSKNENGESLKIVLDDYKLMIIVFYSMKFLNLQGQLGKLVNMDLVTFQATRLVFHTQSEHSIENKNYDLEAQVYFESTTPGSIARKAVLSILFKKKAGAKNYFFDNDINIIDLPDRGEKSRPLKTINIENLFKIDKDDTFVPFSYYQYEGSNTSPPCEEETTWYIAHPILNISTTIVDYFRDIFKPPSVKTIFNVISMN